LLLEAFEIPESFKDSFVEAHSGIAGHHGLEATLRKLKKNQVKSDYMRAYTKTLIRKCPVCQKMGLTKDPKAPSLYHTSTDHPMSRLNIDTIGPFPKDEAGYEHILVIIDTFTRWTELYPLRSTSAEEAAVCMLNHVCTFGVPKQILTDNGPQFANSLVKSLTRMLGSQKLTTIPYSKEENAIVERANKEVSRHLEAFVLEKNNKRKWSAFLPFVKRILNASLHSSIGQTPADMLFAKSIDLDKGYFVPLDEISEPEEIDIHDWIVERAKAAERIMEVAKATQDSINLREMEKRKARFSNVANEAQIQIGDFVLVDRPTGEQNSKLSSARHGPVEVVGIEKQGRELHVQFTSPTGRQSIRRITKERAHIFDQDPKNSIDPAILAATDPENFFEVEEIIKFVGSLKYPHKLKFVVKWKDYPNEDNSLLPLKELINNTIFIEWASNHAKPSIRKLVE